MLTETIAATAAANSTHSSKTSGAIALVATFLDLTGAASKELRRRRPPSSYVVDNEMSTMLSSYRFRHQRQNEDWIDPPQATLCYTRCEYKQKRKYK
jgi:hypothetical protein